VGFGEYLNTKKKVGGNVSENYIKGPSRCVLVNKQYLVIEIKEK
jgi:hypothetical protein